MMFEIVVGEQVQVVGSAQWLSLIIAKCGIPSAINTPMHSSSGHQVHFGIQGCTYHSSYPSLSTPLPK